MSTRTTAAPELTRVFVAPRSPAGELYRRGRLDGARARGFSSEPQLDLKFMGGKTIQQLTFTNVYLGGAGAWSDSDMQQIDSALSRAMGDPHLNNVLAQYYPGMPTTTFKPSQKLQGPLPATVFKDTIEGMVAGLDQQNSLSGFDLSSTVFCFMLPQGIVLADSSSSGHQEHQHELPGHDPDSEQADSKHGLGGYHGSIHPKHGSTTDTVYYAIGVYSEGDNGIPAFDQPWKSVCATFYHELCEARTDPDVEDAIRDGKNSHLGWYSPHGGEIGDIPMEEAGSNLSLVMKEVKLADGSTAPIQLQWSNAVAGPEGPINKPHPHLHAH